MALQHNFELDEVIYPEAYSRVIHVMLFKDTARVFVNTYANREVRELEPEPSAQPIFQKEYEVELDSLEGIAFPMAYAWLKTQPEFENATDC